MLLIKMLQITAAHGPGECEQAVAITLRALLRDAEQRGVALQIVEENASAVGYKSVLLQLPQDVPQAWLATWVGNVQCVFASPLRPGHRRKNWFVGVQRCDLPDPETVQIADQDIVFQACRASGKGGQHVNTTDSAVHALHVPSGISVKVMAERSQHANKRLARSLIAMRLAERQELKKEAAKQERSQQHWSLIRGNPVRVLRGS